MNKITHHLNITLLCLNVLGLTAYSTFRKTSDSSLTFLPPFLLSLITPSTNPIILRTLYCLVATLALVSVFISNQLLSVLAASIALGISLNLAYELINHIQFYQSQLTVRLYEGALNLSIALGVLLSTLGSAFEFTIISAQLMVLTTTLINFYLPTFPERERRTTQNNINSKVCFALVPFYMQTWTYSIGYAIGVYLNTFGILSPSKHAKYLVVSLLILIEVLAYQQQVKMVSELLRSVLIYHFERNTKLIELAFVFAFLVLRLQFPENSLNFFLIIGYIAIAVSAWRSEYRQPQYTEDKEQIPEKESDIEMKLIRSIGPSQPASSIKLKRNTSRLID